MMNRLFISLDIPSQIQDEIIQIRDSIYGSDTEVRWEAKQKLHLTLKFLGEVDKEITNDIINILDETARNHDSLGLSFSRFGLFYRDNNPKILWIGLNDSDPLQQLYHTVDKNMESLGFQLENKKFKPHITLLRFRGFENIEKIKKFTEFKLVNMDFTADTISLMKSKLTPQGSIYTQLQGFKLN